MMDLGTPENMKATELPRTMECTSTIREITVHGGPESMKEPEQNITTECTNTESSGVTGRQETARMTSDCSGLGHQLRLGGQNWIRIMIVFIC
jgi:hypothetical protein